MAFDSKCPGSARIRSPVPEDFPCPECGNEVEIWSIEYKATCDKCGTVVYRQKDTSCLQWCEYAAQCVGTTRYRQFLEQVAEAEAREKKPE